MRLILILLTLALATPVWAAAPVPFEDINGDGIYTPGVDVDLSAAVSDGGCGLSYFTEHSLVFPRGSVPVKPWCYVAVGTLGSLTWDAHLEVSPRDGQASVDIKGDRGATFGRGVRILSGGYQYLGSNGQRLTIGDDGVYESVFEYVEFAAYDNFEDPTEFVMGRNVTAMGVSVEFHSFGSLSVQPGLIVVADDDFGVIADRAIVLDQAKRLEMRFLTVSSGETVSFQRNAKLTIPGPDAEGFIGIYGAGLVNLTGTKFPPAVFVDVFGDPVVGP